MNDWLLDLAKKLKSRNGNTLASWPKTIVQQYEQLQRLADEGNLYGVMLQTKDLFEEIIKLPSVMALIVLDSSEGSMSNEKSIGVAQKLLSQPMTMGAWYSLALHMVKKQKELLIPTGLAAILKKTTILFQQPITDEISDIVNWRNNSIGHGALRFSESESYREELERIFHMLAEYIDGESRYSVNGLYGNISLVLDSSDDHLVVDGVAYRFGNFAEQVDAKTYLFESYYSNKRITKYQSESGSQFSRRMQYFDDLYRVCFRQNASQEKIRADFVSRENDLLLEYLNNPETYIKPKYIVDQLQAAMDEMGKGVILIRMERGMGKTAFASRLDGLYTSRKECLLPESLVRCYHVSNCDLKGIEDYYHSFNYAFKHSYSHAEDIRESGSETIDIMRSSPTVRTDLAAALEKYHEWYGREYTVFVVDGIDEMSATSEEIFGTIPSGEELAEGTFVLLLSRFEDENTVDWVANKYIQRAVSLADRMIDVRRNTPENTALLVKYICTCDPSYSVEAAERIAERADHRMLFVKPYMVLPEETASAVDETDLIRHYYDRLSVFLNDKQEKALARLSVVVALLQSISVEDMNLYLDCFDITYQSIGLLNDLKPLMTISHVQGKTYYSFASIAYQQYVHTRYYEESFSVIKMLVKNINQGTEQYRITEKVISRCKVDDFSDFGINTTSNDIKQLRELLYERLYFYAYAISIIFRFAKGDMRLWNTIADKRILDDIVVFLGKFSYDYRYLYGFGSGTKTSNPYNLCNEILAEYIKGAGLDYINKTIDDYVDYILNNYDQITVRNTNVREYFLDACAGMEFKDQLPLIDLIKTAIEGQRDITRLYWMLCFIWSGVDEDQGVYEAIDRAGMLESLIEYKLKVEIPVRIRHNTNLSVDFSGILSADVQIDKVLEERILNTLLHSALLIELNEQEYWEGLDYSFAVSDGEYTKRYLKTIMEKGYNIYPEIYVKLNTVFPNIVMEANEERKVIAICEKINDSLMYYETVDTIDEISNLIHTLPASSLTSSWTDIKLIVDTLSRIYGLAEKAADQNNLSVFVKKTGLYSDVFITEMLLLCADYHVFDSNRKMWTYWLKNLFKNDIDTLTERYEIGIRELNRLLFVLQRDYVFEEEDPSWLFFMDYWICHYEGSSLFINRPLKEKMILGDKVFKNKLFCTNNTIKLLSVYFKHEKYRERAFSLIRQLKDDIIFVFSACNGKNTTLDRRLLRSLNRYKFAIEQYNDFELTEYFPENSWEKTESEQLYSIIERIETYHFATELTDPIIRIFDWYYEGHKYKEAIELCSNAINKLQCYERNIDRQNSMASQLSIALYVIRSFFAHISKREEDKVYIDMEIDSETIYHNHILPDLLDSEDDGFLSGLYSYQSECYNGKDSIHNPERYMNNYLKSFFAGNGINELGPNYYMLQKN